jgi:hypothetical protein
VAKCCFGNTRTETEFRSVQNASSQLPAGTPELIVCGRRRGGVPMSLLPVRPVSQGNKEGHRKGRTGRGAKGTFQGEQRPTETDPPTTTNGG